MTAAPTTFPAAGPGSVASFGNRLVAFIVDAICADVLAIIINGGFHPGDPQNLATYLAFLAIELIFVAAAGQTPGMRAVGIAVVRADGGGRVQPQWVLLRTVLLATIIPALFTDRSGRAMHDRAAGAVMLRTR
ncbi:MAG TPA: RDD family protein [Mycobacteriales bacterium]|nr:RDD family protein [Mycobacteriales bacterium]